MSVNTRLEILKCLEDWVIALRATADAKNAFMHALSNVKAHVPEGLYVVLDSVVKVNHFESPDAPVELIGRLDNLDIAVSQELDRQMAKCDAAEILTEIDRMDTP